jgi:hypothetical protein
LKIKGIQSLWCLTKGGQFKVKDLMPCEIVDIHLSLEIIARQRLFKTKIQEIDLSLKDFFDWYNRDYFVTNENNTDPNISIDLLFTQLNRFLGNTISALEFVIDQIENTIRKIYGSESEQLVQWNSFKAGLYNSNFAYRFLYNLRNYSQHVNHPIIYKLEIITVDETKFIKRPSLVAYFEKDILFRSETFFKKMKNDLGSYGNYFPVNTIMLNSLALPSLIESKYQELEAKKHIGQRKYLNPIKLISCRIVN